jgi:transposase
MKQPEDVRLSREEGEALIERIERNALSAEDRRVLVKILTFYFWLLFALREAKLSLKRLKALVFGEKPKKPTPPSSGGTPSGGSPGGRATKTAESQEGQGAAPAVASTEKPRLPGHGRQGADIYRAVTRVECRHEELAEGERCPACGRGRLYRLPPGVEMRLDGHALLSAVRYELEKLRCSACGQIFTASVPAVAGTEKYSARARAVLALARYYLGVPWYRLESFQELVGVPVPDATQWDQVELVGDCTYPVFRYLEKMAAQGEVIFQDDTPQRVLTLIEENQKAAAQAQASGAAPLRTGMQTTALIVQGGERRICLYYTGRRHAGENLEALLTQREPGRDGQTTWDRSVVWGMLKNPAYKGTAGFGKTRIGALKRPVRAQRGRALQSRQPYASEEVPREEWIFVPVPAIIEAELYDLVQEQLTENRRRARQGQRGVRSLLQGLLGCKVCGYAYYGKAISPRSRKGHSRAYA